MPRGTRERGDDLQFRWQLGFEHACLDQRAARALDPVVIEDNGGAGRIVPWTVAPTHEPEPGKRMLCLARDRSDGRVRNHSCSDGSAGGSTARNRIR